MENQNNENYSNGNNNNNNGNNNNGRQNRNGMFFSIIVMLLMFVVFLWMTGKINGRETTEITYNEFIKMIDDNNIEKVVISSDRYVITPKKTNAFYDNAKSYYTGIVNDEELTKKLVEAGIPFTAEVEDMSSVLLVILIQVILPIVIMIGIVVFFSRAISKGTGGIMNIGKSNAKLYAMEKETGVTFKDVAGEDEAKESIKEMVDFLHNPGRYQKIGAKLPKGALLVGPPGTGKTLLAKAVAGEAHVPFFSITGSSFVEMYVGVGASRVRDLFKQAQSQAPCIIFIDEIDAIGKSRDSYRGNDESEQTLNQLLAEMDGFDTSKGIIIFAATNRPEILDKALLRPGRFDRRIIVDKPDYKGRLEILKVHAKNVLLDDSVNLEEIAMTTSGAVGSDLANMINEAAINAVKHGRPTVTQADLMESIETVVAGKEKKDRILSPEEKKSVAYHEAGHALLSALQKNAEPVQKITIVPRTMGTLGYVLSAPEEEKFIMTKEEMLAKIIVFFGGRAAERLIFGTVATGASNDIEQATNYARSMVTMYGMSDKFGPIGLESIQNRYLDGRAVMNCGQETASEIDHEVMRIIKECDDKAYELLSENKEILDAVAAFLVEKESITGKQFMEIFNSKRGEKSEAAETEKAETAKSEETETVETEKTETAETEKTETVDNFNTKEV